MIESATAGQRRNAATVNSLFYLQTSMNRLLGETLDGYDKHSLDDMRDVVKVNLYIPDFNTTVSLYRYITL